MFKKAIYKYSIYCGTYTEKEKVLSDFREDIKNCIPVAIEYNKTRLFVTFKDSKYLSAYTLPISYKTEINNKGE